MKPIIGITSKSITEKEWHYLPDEYIRAIEATGGIPILITMLESKEDIQQVATKIDGLLLSGGWDIDPKWYGEEPMWGLKRIDPKKDFLEINLTQIALDKNLPILGICRGCQMLNVVGGGTINQNVRSEKTGIKHWQGAPDDYPTHEIKIEKGSLLHKIVGKDSIRVNSYHHQTIKDVASGFKVSACAQDGAIEAIEHPEHEFVLGVQFHAEYLWPKYPEIRKIFAAFTKAATT